MTSRRELRQQLADAKARVTAVIEQRNEANGRVATAEFNQQRLARQVSELRDQAGAQVQPLVEQPDTPSETWIEERAALKRQISDLTRRLHLATKQAAGLADQCVVLQNANEAMCRNRVDHLAGNLAQKGTAL